MILNCGRHELYINFTMKCVFFPLPHFGLGNKNASILSLGVVILVED